MTYRFVTPEDKQEFPLRMLFERRGDDLYGEACEATDFRGLLAALMDDPDYETTVSAKDRLVQRLKLADSIRIIFAVDDKVLEVADRDGENIINIANDETMIRSLDRLEFVALDHLTRNNAATK